MTYRQCLTRRCSQRRFLVNVAELHLLSYSNPIATPDCPDNQDTNSPFLGNWILVLPFMSKILSRCILLIPHSNCKHSLMVLTSSNSPSLLLVSLASLILLDKVINHFQDMLAFFQYLHPLYWSGSNQGKDSKLQLGTRGEFNKKII